MNEVSLQMYFEQRLKDLDKRISDRFTWSDEAVRKAERTMNERLNSMNEFRDALKDQASRMATRDEMDRLDEAIQELQRAKANFDGRLVILSGGISVVVSAVVWGILRSLSP